ncbi:MAG: cell wall hydrolase [Acetatifactor sp.]
MYKKAISLLLAGYLIFFAGFFCIREIVEARMVFQPVKLLRLRLEDIEREAEERMSRAGLTQSIGKGMGIAEYTVSGQRVVNYLLLEPSLDNTLSDEELEILLRIVEAEAGCEDEEGKLLVANVVLNRVHDNAFPDTIKGVVFQQDGGVTQFSPVADGSYHKVRISEETISAVSRALSGEDISGGALYFAAREYADNSQMKWFDNHLEFLFKHGGHEFFR